MSDSLTPDTLRKMDAYWRAVNYQSVGQTYLQDNPLIQRPSPEVPGSIHEGGELGYSLAHAYGAAFDNPDLIVACVVGDGEAGTGALAASWHSNAIRLQSGAFGFAGQESAGATFMRRDGLVWTTDKDGIATALLSAEITARTGRDPGRS